MKTIVKNTIFIYFLGEKYFFFNCVVLLKIILNPTKFDIIERDVAQI